MYQVIDIQTGKIVAENADGAKARRVAHRKDAAYGAVRFIVRFVEKR